MTFKRATTIGALALTLGSGAWALTTGASAQGTLSGTVAHVDPSTRTIYFTDGSIMQLKPGATLYVDGRVVAIDDLTPGARAEVTRAAMASPATETTTVVSPHPAIDAEGTIASVDAQAGLITFTDGRVVRVTDRTFVWLPMPLAALQPGMNVVAREVQPTVASTTTTPGTPSTTVVTTGPTTVTAAPGAVVVSSPTHAERHATMERGRKADRVDRNRYAGSALPRVGFGLTVPADQVHVHFPPQAP